MTPAEYALSVALDPGLIKEAIGARSLRLSKIRTLAGNGDLTNKGLQGVKGVKSDAKVIANIRSNQGLVRAPSETDSALQSLKPSGDNLISSPAQARLRAQIHRATPSPEPAPAAYNTQRYVNRIAADKRVLPSVEELQRRQAALDTIPKARGWLGSLVNRQPQEVLPAGDVLYSWSSRIPVQKNTYLDAAARRRLQGYLNEDLAKHTALDKQLSIPIVARRTAETPRPEITPETIRNTLPSADARYKAFGPEFLDVAEQSPIWYSPNAKVTGGYAKSESRPFIAATDEATLKRFGQISPVHPHKQTDTRGMSPDQLPPNKPTRSGPIGEAPDYEQVATMPSLSEWLQNNQLYRKHPHNPAELQRLNPRAFGSDAVSPNPSEFNW